MSQISPAASSDDIPMHGHATAVLLRSFIIGLTAFLTVVDLFATQAILPSLTGAYGVTPAAMGFAVNASTMGMAIAGLGVAFFSHWIDRRLGILISLALLAIPTALLAIAPDLNLHDAANHARALHGFGFLAYPCPFGRAVQRDGRRRCIRCLILRAMSPAASSAD